MGLDSGQQVLEGDGERANCPMGRILAIVGQDPGYVRRGALEDGPQSSQAGVFLQCSDQAGWQRARKMAVIPEHVIVSV